MEERKSLASISWQVSEPEYRADPALSYSTLARFQREGFNNIEHLFDRIESPSLTFGSMVDTLITGSREEFFKQFIIVKDNVIPSDSLAKITKRIYDVYKNVTPDLLSIPEDRILEAIKDIQWNNHWLPKTRVKKIKEDCALYYKALFEANGLTMVSQQDYEAALNAVSVLKSDHATRYYFDKDPFFEGTTERFYQLKFKSEIEGIPFRIMADELIVLHNVKLIIPVDLKTSSKPEWDFHKSFLDWGYWIQAMLYWRVIRDNLDKDPYFKDFSLSNYRFVVINKGSLTPLAWEFRETKATDDITVGKHLLRHPVNIAKELSYYLHAKPDVPQGITKDEPNNISQWIEQHDKTT